MAVLKGVPEMQPIVFTSLYDVKPFYMMSIITETFMWIKKEMEVFCGKMGKKVHVPFYQLNLADEYND